jgi:hypothetical protein
MPPMKLVASHTPIIIDRMRNKDTQTDERWVDHGGGLRRALSPTFPAGEMVFFIPWRVVAEECPLCPIGALMMQCSNPLLHQSADRPEKQGAGSRGGTRT